MPSGPWPAVLLTLVGALASGCGPKRVPAPTPPAPALVVLLSDPETGKTGRIRVSNEVGRVELAVERQATLVTPARRPAIMAMSEADVTRLFGAALAALPPPPRHFTLHFQFESDQLTAESVALVSEILKAVKALAVPEVVVVGHTDTMGTPMANVDLGLKRAMTVRNLLVEAGLPEGTIEVTSHGEGDLLIKTPNDRPEPRNRRVEIAVR
jgi:outer membrane protein OmpA-like peptidoglycan-associated protein